jgi:RsiW-degrading membrane proteinase PrsW (M82 family)
MFWLLAVLTAAGLAFFQSLVGDLVPLYTGTASFMLISWTAYVVPFVVALVLLDLHEPEPPAYLALAFVWGALVAVPLASVANTAVASILGKRLGDKLDTSWYPALTGPWTEEALKALGLVVILTLASRQVTTVLDGLVYGAFVGLGFQIAENVLTTTNELLPFHTGTGESVVAHALLVRGLGLGLWSHAVWGAIVGAGGAYVVIRRRQDGKYTARPLLILVGCMLTAITLHFVWNAPWWDPDTKTLEPHDFFLYAAKGIPALVLLAVIVAAALGREVVWFTDALSRRPEVRDDEVAALRTWRGRRAARKAARAYGGRHAERAGRRLQRAQVRLAVAVATGQPDDVLDAAAHRVQLARKVLERTMGADPRRGPHTTAPQSSG